MDKQTRLEDMVKMRENKIEDKQYAMTSKDNWNKYVDTGDNKYLNDINPYKLTKGDRVIIAFEGGENEVEVV